MTSPRLQVGRPTSRAWVGFLRDFAVLVVAILLAALLVRWIAQDNGSPPADTVGSGSVESLTSSPLTINQNAVPADLFPGAPPHLLSGTFTNTGSAAVFISNIEAGLTAVTDGQGSCSLASYRLLNPVMPVGREIPVGENVGSWSGATVQMIDEPATQDGCKLATVNISYTAK